MSNPAPLLSARRCSNLSCMPRCCPSRFLFPPNRCELVRLPVGLPPSFLLRLLPGCFPLLELRLAVWMPIWFSACPSTRRSIASARADGIRGACEVRSGGPPRQRRRRRNKKRSQVPRKGDNALTCEHERARAVVGCRNVTRRSCGSGAVHTSVGTRAMLIDAARARRLEMSRGSA